MKSKKVCRIQFGLARAVALFLAAAIVFLGAVACGSDSGGGDDEPAKFSVNVEESIEYGKVTANATSVPAGTEITLTATPDEGYEFTSFSVKDSDGNEIEVTDGKFIMPAKNVTVSAIFNKKNESQNNTVFTVTFITNGDSSVESQSVERGKTAKMPNPPTKEGFKFDGWFLDEEFTQNFSFDTLITSDVKLYAKWLAESISIEAFYTVKHYQQPANGSKSLSNYMLMEEDTQKLSGEAGSATEAQAKFYAGFTVIDFEQGTISSNGNTVVNIYYDRNEHKITYDDNFDDEELLLPKQMTTRFGAKESLNYTTIGKRAGYDFSGWNTAKDGSGTSYSKQKPEKIAVGDADIVLYAQWTERTDTKYTVCHYQQPSDGSANLTDYKLEESQSLYGTTNSSTTAEAKIYEGFTANKFEQSVIAADGSTVINIYYARKSHTLSYNDGVEDATISVPKSVKVLYGSSQELAFVGVGEKTGYTFTGWNENADGTGAQYSKNGTDSIIIPDSDVTLYAQWEINQYTVTFEVDGVTFEEQAVYYNTTAVRPAAVPTDDNKIFEAWWYKEDVFDFTTPIVSGIELSCHWKTLKENQAIVTYKDETGLTKEQEIVTKNEAITSPEEPKKEGYSFSGWVTRDVDGKESKIDLATGISENTVLYYSWTANDISILDVTLETAPTGNSIPLSYDENTRTFSAQVPAGVTLSFWQWFVEKEIQSGETGTSFTMTDSMLKNIPAGIRRVTVYAKAEDGTLLSGSAKFDLRK